MSEQDKLWCLPAEAAVLGSMIYDKRCIGEVMSIIGQKDFFRPEHGLIFAALVRLFMAGQGTDAVMLRSELSRAGELEKVGGVDYIRRVLESVPSAESAGYYAGVVRNRAEYRALVLAVEGMKNVVANGEDVGEQVRQVQHIALSLCPSAAERVHDMAGEATKVIDWMGAQSDYLPTGYANIDYYTNGLAPGEFVIIAARPGIGKSSLALNIAVNIAREGKSVVFYSLEMTHRALIERAICYVGGISADKIHLRTREEVPKQETIQAICEAAYELEKTKIAFNETANTIAQQRAYLEARRATHGVDLVVVDYIQLMHEQGENRVQQVAAISRQLKGLAMSEHVPIIGLCQLNREVESRQSHRPRLSDLRESGALEQDADIVILLHREHYYRRLEKPDLADEDGSCDAIIAKNRRGRTGTAKLVWLEEITSFGDMKYEEDTKQ